MEEILDCCDQQDRVIGRAPRSVVHSQKMLHRAVHVFIFNSRRQLLVQVRSAFKDEFPNCYTSSASGHLSAGEDYEQTAYRELMEEIGIETPLTFVQKFPASEILAFEHSVLYEGQSDQIPQPDPAEVAGLLSLTLPDLLKHLQEQPEKFSPPFRFLLEWYVQQNPEPSAESAGPA